MMAADRIPAGMPERPHRKLWGLVLMVPLVLSMIALCLLSAEWRQALKVESVQAAGMRSLTRNDVLTLAGVPVKSVFYKLDLMNVRAKLMAEPLIKDVRIHREFPGILQVDVIEREPVAALNCGQMRYVDAEGVVLPYLDGDRKLDLPLIIGISGLQSERIGRPILNKELFAALEIIQQAQTLDTTIYHMISELDMNNGGAIRINSIDAGVPVILGRQDIPKKLLMFETFWTNFVNAGDAQKLKYIDLRFDDEVVVQWNEPPQRQTEKATL
jgi:cell division septal protein FtsQ